MNIEKPTPAQIEAAGLYEDALRLIADLLIRGAGDDAHEAAATWLSAAYTEGRESNPDDHESHAVAALVCAAAHAGLGEAWRFDARSFIHDALYYLEALER